MKNWTLRKWIAVGLILVTLGLADAFFFELLVDGHRDVVSALVFIYIGAQFGKTMILKNKPFYDYLYFPGIIGILTVFFSGLTFSEATVSFVLFLSVLSFLAPPILDLSRKSKKVEG
jgi:hypothetical protein